MTNKIKDRMGHCDKCGKRSITICIPCALRLKNKAPEEQKQEIIKEILHFVESESGKSGRKEIINYLLSKLKNI